jgi:hypothetical protein
MITVRDSAHDCTVRRDDIAYESGCGRDIDCAERLKPQQEWRACRHQPQDSLPDCLATLHPPPPTTVFATVDTYFGCIIHSTYQSHAALFASRLMADQAATQRTGPQPDDPSLTATQSPLSSQARNTFRSSFERFEQTVKVYSSTDHRDFTSTTIEDVRKAARQIEQELASRQCLRNMRRLEPFLDGLEAYSKVVEVLCNGTPFVAWIWVSNRSTRSDMR